MADILLSFGVATTDSDVSEIRKGLDTIITKIEKNPPKVRVGLTVDNDALNHFKKELEAILNTVSLANGAPITLNISGLGEISTQATQAAGAMKKATGSIKQQSTALSTVLQKYEQAHALLRKNANANDTTSQSYKGLAAQVKFFEETLERARQESLDINTAFAKNGIATATAIQNMTTAMSAFRAEMEHTGTSGTVASKQLYDVVAQMESLINGNKNASSLSSYTELGAQFTSLSSAMKLVKDDGLSVEVAFERLGIDGSSAINEAKTAMSAFRAEMEQAGASGTVTAKQLYDTVAKMREAITGNKNAHNLDSYKAISTQLGDWETAADLVRQGSATVEQALSQIGNSSDSANVKIIAMSTALSSLNEEMKRTGISGTTTKAQIDRALSQANSLLQSNGSAFELKTFTELQTLLSKLTSLMGSVKADGSDLFDKLEQGGFEASTVVKTLQDAMQALRTEITATGQSGTVTAKQLYDMVVKMRDAVNKNKNASGLDSYQVISSQLGDWETAADLVRQGSATVEQALSQIGSSSDSASAKVVAMSTALSSLNEEMKRTGTSGTTTRAQIDNAVEQAHKLLRTNGNAMGLKSFSDLERLLIRISPLMSSVKADGSDLFDKLEQGGFEASTVVKTLQDAMAALNREIGETGQSGTVTAKQLYDTVAKMRDIVTNTSGKNNFKSFADIEKLYGTLSLVEQKLREGTSVSQAFYEANIDGATIIKRAETALSSFAAETAGAKVKVYDYATQLKQVNTAIEQTQKNLERWTKAKSGKSASSYADLEQQLENFIRLRDQLNQRGTGFAGFESDFARISTAVQKASGEIKVAGENTQTWGDRIRGLAEKFGAWLSVSQVIMACIRNIKKMVSTVIELDSAMTELKKVTSASDATYDRFLTNAAKRAKDLGATLADVISATADFARLGYGIEDASHIADAAIIYKNVGDGIEDISQASESIISTMQAFGIEASNVMTIVDKFNEVGNNFAISSTGIGEALLNSASALNAAGNTLDESIALITAANEVIQSPEKVGTAMKTLSMYIRAAKVEAEEAGIETEGMANSVSELRTQILDLTRNRVDIMESDDDFKSTYQIVKELAAVWKTLKETEQAAITELIGGGVRNANVISALMNNFAAAEEVLATSAGAAGSALKENEVYLKSIEGKISQFKAAWQNLSNTIVNSGLVKIIVDIGTGLTNIVNGIASFAGGTGALSGVIMALGAIEQKFGTFSGLWKDIIKGVTNFGTTFAGGAKWCP